MLKKFGIVIVAMAILAGHNANAATWYVDNAASGSNTGTSWADAWESFSDISWADVSEEDTIYISGGSQSKTYSESLAVGASGSSGAPITISVGQNHPHNGTVIIDRSSSGTGLQISGRTHVVVTGQVGNGSDNRIQITHTTNPAVLISGESHSISLKYLEVSHVAYSGTDWDRLITIAVSTSYATFASNSPIEISHCSLHHTTDAIHMSAPTTGTSYASSYGTALRIHDCDIYDIRDDGITLAAGSADIYNNTIRDRISPIEGHPDAIQVWGRYYRIYSNEFHGWQDITSGNAVIYVEPDGGNNMDLTNNQPCCWQIFNNLIHEDETVGGTCDAIEIGFSDPDFTSVSELYILNNTIVGSVYSGMIMGWSSTPASVEVSDIYVMNNIFDDQATVMLNYVSGSGYDWGSVNDGEAMVFDYNFYRIPEIGHITYGAYGAAQQYTQWSAFENASGCQFNPTGVDETQSAALNSQFKPDADDNPVVDIGYDWSSIFSTDRDGNDRDQWDIGAYEYTTNDPPPDDEDQPPGNDSEGSSSGCMITALFNH